MGSVYYQIAVNPFGFGINKASISSRKTLRKTLHLVTPAATGKPLYKAQGSLWALYKNMEPGLGPPKWFSSKTTSGKA